MADHPSPPQAMFKRETDPWNNQFFIFLDMFQIILTFMFARTKMFQLFKLYLSK